MYMLTVAKKGSHYFSTQGMNIKKTEAGRMYNHFREIFPDENGYKITVYNLQNSSTDETEVISKLVNENGGYSPKDL
jgi:hypothetical protein